MFMERELGEKVLPKNQLHISTTAERPFQRFDVAKAIKVRSEARR